MTAPPAFEAIAPVSAPPPLPPFAPPPIRPEAGAPLADFSEALRSAALDARAAKVGERFEAATLTSFFGNLLPSADNPVWGGSAGHFWRTLFAENLATEVARTGGVGLAEVIDRLLAERSEGA